MYVNVDPAQMKQVLINLVQNAADSIGRTARSPCGPAQPQAAAARARKTVVILEVSDTGRGIPPEAQKRLFDPFFTTKENGTGLGCPSRRGLSKNTAAPAVSNPGESRHDLWYLLPQVTA